MVHCILFQLVRSFGTCEHAPSARPHVLKIFWSAQVEGTDRKAPNIYTRPSQLHTKKGQQGVKPPAVPAHELKAGRVMQLSPEQTTGSVPLHHRPSTPNCCW